MAWRNPSRPHHSADGVVPDRIFIKLNAKPGSIAHREFSVSNAKGLGQEFVAQSILFRIKLDKLRLRLEFRMIGEK